MTPLRKLRLEGSHYGYCHFTYKNRNNSWSCCCDVIKGYLEWCMDEKMNRKLKDLAEHKHRTLAGQIRLILEDYLEKLK